MTTKTKPKKEKINIMGKKYKVEKPISDTLKALSEALHAHEVALLTWVHKDYSGDESQKNKDIFRESLNEYCLNIPEAEHILIRMKELDDQLEKELAAKKEEESKKQNKEEKESGAKE